MPTTVPSVSLPAPKAELQPIAIPSLVPGYPVTPVDPKAFPSDHEKLKRAMEEGFGVELFQVSGPLRGFRITRTRTNPDGSILVEPVSSFFVRSDGNSKYLSARNRTIGEYLDREMRHPPLRIPGLPGQDSPTALSFNASPEAWGTFSAEQKRIGVKIISAEHEGATPHTVYQLINSETGAPLGDPIHTSIFGNLGPPDRNALLLAAAERQLYPSSREHRLLTLESAVPNFPVMMLARDQNPRFSELVEAAQSHGLKVTFLGHEDGMVNFRVSLEGKPDRTFGVSTTDFDTSNVRDRALAAKLWDAMQGLEPKSLEGALERKQRLVEQLVVDHANTSPEFRESVRYGLSLLPESLLKELSTAGVKVEAKWYMRQDDAGVAPPPRGHDGKDLNAVPGVFRTDLRSIVVTEKLLETGTNKYYDGTAWTTTTIHEVGHAIDFIRHLSRSGNNSDAASGDRWPNGVSYSSPLLAAYRADWDRLPAALKGKDSPVSYFLQPEYNADFRAGQQEAFAEAFQVVIGGAIAQNRDQFFDRFPNVLRAVRDLVEEARKKDSSP